jgi:predicted O-methyltransferase YrrM
MKKLLPLVLTVLIAASSLVYMANAAFPGRTNPPSIQQSNLHHLRVDDFAKINDLQ